MRERPARRERGARSGDDKLSSAGSSAATNRPFSNDPLDDAVAVQRLQGFLGGDTADAEELRKLHLRGHAIPDAQPACPDLVQYVVVQPLVKERPLVVLDAHDEGDTLV